VISTVVFDADETLVDLRPAVRGALAVVLDEIRRLTPAAAAVSLADLESDWTAVFPAMRAEPVTDIRRAALARSLARVGLAASLERIAELFFAHRFALTRPYDEVPAVLSELRRSYAVGFATNGNSRASVCGLAGEFSFEVYAHVDGVPKKPAAGFFAEVLARARCGPRAVAHVGDSWEHDVAGARAAGMRAIWLNRAGLPTPEAGVADAEIRTLADLPTALATLPA
jgi:FMN hydrolase / 5-amino-6-(5-phospho-D-ribitylamino)uracil phosphatase